MRFHFPSLLVGSLAALAFVSFMAADRPSIPLGRFELEATPNHVFILDRDTGRVWQKYVTVDSGQSDQDFALPKVR